MNGTTRKRLARVGAIAAVGAVLGVGATAQAADTSVAINGTFATAGAGWTSSATCSTILCTVVNAVDTNGNVEPGAATATYSSILGLGGLSTGTSTWISPRFTWSGAAPASATLGLARKASLGALLAIGGSAGWSVELVDETTNATFPLVDEALAASDSAWVTKSFTLAPSFLSNGHVYHVALHARFQAGVALLNSITIGFDDVTVVGSNPTSVDPGPNPTPTDPTNTTSTSTSSTSSTSASGSSSSSGSSSASGSSSSASGAGASGSGGGTTASTSTTTKTSTNAHSGTKSSSKVRLIAVRTLEVHRGRTATLRVRAVVGKRAVARLRLTVKVAGKTKRIVTNTKGYATIRVSLKAVRGSVTVRSGSAKVTTKLVRI